MKILELPSATRTPFICRLVETGDRFGLNYQLVNGDMPMIEFYDTRYEHTEYGQFVSRYFVETLQKSRTCWKQGLCLDGGVPEWSVDAERMKIVLDWLDEMYPEPWPEAFV